MNEQTAPENTMNPKRHFSSSILGAITAILGIGWAILQYIFPDPMIYLYSIWRPEYVLIFISTFIALLSVALFIWSYLKNKFLFFLTALLIYTGSSFFFFIMGKVYFSPEFTDGLPKVTANTGSIYYRGIEFAHQFCDRKADTLSCNLIVSNRRGQASVNPKSWRLVMKDGAVFKDHIVFLGGQKQQNYRTQLDLPQGVEAQIQVVFYEIPNKYTKILKLGFDVNNEKFGFKDIITTIQ